MTGNALGFKNSPPAWPTSGTFSIFISFDSWRKSLVAINLLSCVLNSLYSGEILFIFWFKIWYADCLAMPEVVDVSRVNRPAFAFSTILTTSALLNLSVSILSPSFSILSGSSNMLINCVKRGSSLKIPLNIGTISVLNWSLYRLDISLSASANAYASSGSASTFDNAVSKKSLRCFESASIWLSWVLYRFRTESALCLSRFFDKLVTWFLIEICASSIFGERSASESLISRSSLFKPLVCCFTACSSAVMLMPSFRLTSAISWDSFCSSNLNSWFCASITFSSAPFIFFKLSIASIWLLIFLLTPFLKINSTSLTFSGFLINFWTSSKLFSPPEIIRSRNSATDLVILESPIAFPIFWAVSESTTFCNAPPARPPTTAPVPTSAASCPADSNVCLDNTSASDAPIEPSAPPAIPVPTASAARAPLPVNSAPRLAWISDFRALPPARAALPPVTAPSPGMNTDASPEPISAVRYAPGRSFSASLYLSRVSFKASS